MKRPIDVLIGLTVMVCPKLDYDPGNRQGETGKIVSFHPEKLLSKVIFKDRSDAIYLPDSLIALKSKKAILAALTSGLVTNGTDCLTILKIYHLISVGKFRKALRLATINDNAIFYCTQCLTEVIFKPVSYEKIKRK
ncbi:MAG: hypothetical protein ACTHJ8_08900 [Mucilaginibacter sp.]